MFGVSNLVIAAGAVVAWLAFFIVKLIVHRRSYRNLPKPPHSFLWGHLKLFGEIDALFPPQTHPQFVYTEMAKRYSLPDIFYVDLWPIGPPQMIVTGAEAAVEVTVTKPYPMHPVVETFLNVMIGKDIIAATNGNTWRALHHMIGPSLTPAAIKPQLRLIASHVEVFRSKLLSWVNDEAEKQGADSKAKAKAGAVVRVEEETAKLIFDVISDIVLGFPLGAQQKGSPLLSDFRCAMDLGQRYLHSWNPLERMSLWWNIRLAKIDTDRYIAEEFMKRYNDFISRPKLPHKREAKCIMDRFILQQLEHSPDRKLDKAFIGLAINNLKAILIGGHGTTTDTIAYCLMLLGMHPEALQRMCDEHDRVFGTTAPETLSLLETNPSKTNELEYTNAVIKETLRLFNVGLSVRAAPEGVTHLRYKGEDYPVANQMIVLCQQASHFDPRNFPEPTRFVPDRFLDSYEPKAHRFAWRPFERGTRACMGQETAMEEMRIVLLLVARWFNFELLPETVDAEAVASLGAGPVVEKKKSLRDVAFTDWESRIGDQAFQRVTIGAGPRRGLPLRVTRNDREWS